MVWKAYLGVVNWKPGKPPQGQREVLPGQVAASGEGPGPGRRLRNCVTGQPGPHRRVTAELPPCFRGPPSLPEASQGDVISSTLQMRKLRPRPTPRSLWMPRPVHCSAPQAGGCRGEPTAMLGEDWLPGASLPWGPPPSFLTGVGAQAFSHGDTSGDPPGNGARSRQ